MNQTNKHTHKETDRPALVAQVRWVLSTVVIAPEQTLEATAMPAPSKLLPTMVNVLDTIGQLVREIVPLPVQSGRIKLVTVGAPAMKLILETAAVVPPVMVVVWYTTVTATAQRDQRVSTAISKPQTRQQANKQPRTVGRDGNGNRTAGGTNEGRTGDLTGRNNRQRTVADTIGHTDRRCGSHKSRSIELYGGGGSGTTRQHQTTATCTGAPHHIGQCWGVGNGLKRCSARSATSSGHLYGFGGRTQ